MFAQRPHSGAVAVSRLWRRGSRLNRKSIMGFSETGAQFSLLLGDSVSRVTDEVAEDLPNLTFQATEVTCAPHTLLNQDAIPGLLPASRCEAAMHTIR